MKRTIKPQKSHLVLPQKVIWENIHANNPEWRDYIENPITHFVSPNLIDRNFENGLNIFYFVIANNPGIERTSVWNAAKTKLTEKSVWNRLAEAEIITQDNTSLFGKIYTESMIDFNNQLRHSIYQGKWQKNRYLPTLKSEGIFNLCQRINESFK